MVTSRLLMQIGRVDQAVAVRQIRQGDLTLHKTNVSRDFMVIKWDMFGHVLYSNDALNDDHMERNRTSEQSS